jgi:predicted solute-binding protein
VSLASRGAVDSVALYTSKPIREVQSIALDASSRTSVALVGVLCARLFKIKPRMEPQAPEAKAMLARCDAALVIGDNALFLDHQSLGVDKIDLGEAWFRLTGLPFVYAFWAGRPGALTTGDVAALVAARDAGVLHSVEIAESCYPDAARRTIAARYLRDNMKYDLDDEEQAGLNLFYAYAAELGLVRPPRALRFYP